MMIVTSDGPMVVPDLNPERIACVLCGDTGRHRRLETVIGPVCGACFEAAAPESAPYYADWQREGERADAARERQRKRAQQATRRRVVRL